MEKISKIPVEYWDKNKDSVQGDRDLIQLLDAAVKKINELVQKVQELEDNTWRIHPRY